MNRVIHLWILLPCLFLSLNSFNFFKPQIKLFSRRFISLDPKVDDRIATASYLKSPSPPSTTPFPFAGSTVYDAKAMDKYFDARPVPVWRRILTVGIPFVQWWILQQIDKLLRPFRSEQYVEESERMLARDLKNAIVKGKSVTFIKSGQALALRPDVIKSPVYISELQKLHDEVGTFDNEIAMNMIREELGVEPSELFEFDPVSPIASASIGQVYRARLKKDNRTVAVKVQRPDALACAAIDMYILRRIAAFVRKRKGLRSNLVGIVNEFGSQLFAELNYQQEALNCLRFRQLYGSIPGIYVPEAYPELTSRRVLTMEYVEGEKGPWTSGGEKMLTVGLKCSVFQLLGAGYFHSDPHRGNLFQTPQGDLAYIDFGMMTEVPTSERYALIGATLGLVNQDIPMVIKNLQSLDFFAPDANATEIVGALEAAISNSTDDGEISTINFTRLNQNLQLVSKQVPFQLPPFYSLIIRTLVILEGLALSVDSSFRLIRGAYPFIAQQILTSTTDSPELNELLKCVLLDKQGSIRWDRLEKFIAISARADRASKGDFAALKGGGDEAESKEEKERERRRDATVVVTDFVSSLKNAAAYVTTGANIANANGNVTSSTSSREPPTISEASRTLSVTLQIMDFLLSENGRFLREPLVLEVVDTLDSLGLTAVAMASMMSQGLIPAPSEKPKKEKVEQFSKLVQVFLDARRGVFGETDSSESSSPKKKVPERKKQASGAYALFLFLLDTVSDVVKDSLRQQAVFGGVLTAFIEGAAVSADGSNSTQLTQRATIEDVSNLLARTTALVVQVLAKLAERNAVRAVRSIVNPKSVAALLSTISRITEILRVV